MHVLLKDYLVPTANLEAVYQLRKIPFRYKPWIATFKESQNNDDNNEEEQ